MPRYKCIYCDINYQNRNIITLTRENDDGSQEVIRASIEGQDDGRNERKFLAFGIYKRGEDARLAYHADQNIYSEGILLNEHHAHDPESIDNPLATEKYFARIPEESPLTAIHQNMMNFLTIEFYPYPVILKKFFFATEVQRSELTGCDYSQVTDLSPQHIQQVAVIFEQCKQQRLFPAIASVVNQGVFAQPSAPAEYLVLPEYYQPPSHH